MQQSQQEQQQQSQQEQANKNVSDLFSANNANSNNMFSNLPSGASQSNNSNNNSNTNNDLSNEEKQVKLAIFSKREEFRVELRKKNIDKKLQTKRLKYTSQNKQTQKKQYTENDITEVIQKISQTLTGIRVGDNQYNIEQLNQDQKQVLIQLIIQVRIMSCQEIPVAVICKQIDILGFFLQNISKIPQQDSFQETLVTESAWIFANLAFYGDIFPFENQNIMKVLLTNLFNLLFAQNISIISISLHCIANMVSETDFTKQLCLELNLLETIEKTLTQKQFNEEMLQTISQLLNAVTHVDHKNVQEQNRIPVDKLPNILNMIKIMIPFSKNSDDIVYNLLKCMSNLILSKYSEEQIGLILTDNDIVSFILNLAINYVQFLPVILELSMVFIIISKDYDKYFDVFLQNNFLSMVKEGISYKEASIRRNFAVIVANIVCMGQQKINIIFESGLIDTILNKLTTDQMSLKREYLNIILNTMKAGNHEHFKYLLDNKLIPIFAYVLKEEDAYAVKVIVKSLRHLYDYASDIKQQQQSQNNNNNGNDGIEQDLQTNNCVFDQMQNSGIDTIIEQLQNHPDDSVYDTISKFIEDYLSYE